MPGVVETTDTFTTNQVITSSALNNIIDQTLFTSDAIVSANTTLALVAGKLKVGTITSNEMGTGAVTANALDSNAVTTVKITDANVTTAKIADSAVTTAKILDANVTTAKIADANITTAKLAQPITRATAQSTTSGTSINFTGIPSWAKRITVLFSAVSNNVGNEYLIQIGDAGGIENTGYVSEAGDRAGEAISTEGFILTRASSSTSSLHGIATICNLSGNLWVLSANISISSLVSSSAGSKTLSDTLTQLRITTVGGTDVFDAGSINIIYE
jgi:hypothetical protein